MSDRTWIYVSLSLGSIALVLVIVLFIIIIVGSANETSQPTLEFPANKRSQNFSQIIDALANKDVSLQNPPSSLDGVLLESGNTVLLNGQNEVNENGLYEIKSPTEWQRTITPENGIMLVNGGIQYGRRLLMVGRNNQQVSDIPLGKTKVLILESDIPKESRRLTVQEIQEKGLVIAATDVVILPDPSEFKGANIGEIFKLVLINANEEKESDVLELGYSSHWTCKTESTEVSFREGGTFVLRIIDGPAGEIYRIFDSCAAKEDE